MGAAAGSLSDIVHEDGNKVMELDQFISIYDLSTGRRIYALSRTQRAAQALSFDEMVKRVEEVIAEDRRTYHLDMQWSGYRDGLLTVSPSIRPIDARVDNVITSLRDAAVAQAGGAASDDPIHQKVEEFLAKVLPGGVFAVTSLPYVEQLPAVESMVDALQGPLAGDVQELNLQRQVKRLAELLELYRDVINAASDNSFDFATVSAARKRGQRNLLEIIARILGAYPLADDPAHKAARAALLGPIVEQNEAVRAYLRARRAVRDIDPETGEPAGPADPALPEQPTLPELPEMPKLPELPTA